MLEPGTEVLVTWGAETFRPIQYTAVTVGPFALTGRSLEGETLADTVSRLGGNLERVARVELRRKMNEFMDRVRVTSDMVKRG